MSRYLETGHAKIIGIGREVTGLRRDGTTFPLHLSVGEMMVGSERKFTGIVHDLTERTKLIQQLRGSEERWRSIIESAVDGIVVIDSNGRIEAFNPAAERLFAYQASEVLGHNVNVLMPSPYHEEHDGYLARYLATGDAKIIGIGREVMGRRRDGTTFPLRLSVGEMSIGGERKFTGILHDLTARVHMEEQLREQASLVRLGEMAAVIAHEVKNPLAGIRGAVQVIGGRLPADSREAAVTGEIISRIDTLNGLIQDLLLFARPPQPKPALVDVSSLIVDNRGSLDPRRSVERNRYSGGGGIGSSRRGPRTAEDRVSEPDCERCTSHARQGQDLRFDRCERRRVRGSIYRCRARNTSGHSPEDFHPVLYDEGTRHRTRPPNRKTPH